MLSYFTYKPKKVIYRFSKELLQQAMVIKPNFENNDRSIYEKVELQSTENHFLLEMFYYEDTAEFSILEGLIEEVQNYLEKVCEQIGINIPLTDVSFEYDLLVHISPENEDVDD